MTSGVEQVVVSGARRKVAVLSLIAAAYTYALVVFGGIVRITGSGLGCGDDWPRCNGEWIPVFTFETFIEYMHRMLAAGIGVVVLSVFVYALVKRSAPGVSGKGGLTRPLALASVLLVFQALLGAVTVRLELPPAVTVAHFVTAMIFMGTLIIASVRGGVFGEVGLAARPETSKATTWAITTAAVGLIVVAFGAVTANTPGAPPACMGFPLCSGQLFPPAGAVPAEIHWAHRVAAYSLLFLVFAAAMAASRAGAARPVRKAAWVSAWLVALQIVVAAGLVLMSLPPAMQAFHLVVGAAVWFSLVVWVTLARLESNPVVAA